MMNIKKLAVSALASAMLCAAVLAAGCAGGKVDTPDPSAPPVSAVPTEKPKATDAPLEIPVEKVLAVGDDVLVHTVYSAFYDMITYVRTEREPDKEGTTRKCIFGGREYELFYKRTRTFTLGGARYYDYAASSDGFDVWTDPYMQRYPIGFHSSGALAYIDNWLFEPALTLDFEGKVDADSVRAAVEKLLGSEVDFEKLEHFESKYWKASGRYDMRWFNEMDGEILPGEVKASVSWKGELLEVEASDPEYEPLPLPDGFDFEPYLAAIEKKARTLCIKNDESTVIRITEYSAKTINGSPYVFVRVDVDYDHFSFPDRAYKTYATFAVPIE